MGGHWADLWTTFVKGLSHGGIKLRNSENSLLWMYDKKSGLVLAKRAYDLIVSDFLPHPPENPTSPRNSSALLGWLIIRN